MGDRSPLEAFNRNFRKKQRAQLRLARGEDSPSPPPNISLQIVEGYELCPAAPKSIKQTHVPTPLEPKERGTCFRKVLDQQTKKPKLPPIALAPKPPEKEKPKQKDGGEMTLRMVHGLKPHSKQHKSGAALGITMQRLQQDPERYNDFVADIERRVNAGKDLTNRDIRRNIQNARHYIPHERRKMLTARLQLRQLHVETVQARGSDLKTARATAMEAKVNANELRRDKIYDRRAHREKLYLQQKVAWLIALHARTGFIVQVICESREVSSDEEDCFDHHNTAQHEGMVGIQESQIAS